MSTAASEEAASQNKHLAEIIDWRLSEIAIELGAVAHLLSEDPFRGADEEPIAFFRLIDVGELSCTNTGAHSVRLTARLYGHDDQLGFWKEYGFRPGQLTNPNTSTELRDSGPTVPDELIDCPDRYALVAGLQRLHNGFMGATVIEHTELAEIIQLDDFRPA